MVVLVPAYGRDYKSVEEVIGAWLSGKDFLDLLKGCYVNKDDAPKDCAIVIEFNRRTRSLRVDNYASN